MKQIVTTMFLVVSLIAAIGIFSDCYAFEENEKKDLFSLSLKELTNLKVKVATKTEMSEEDAPSIISVVTAREIEDMGARNLEDVLRKVVGIQMTHDSQILKIGIRGIVAGNRLNNKVRWMIDGHGLTDVLTGDPGLWLWAIPIKNIDKIEIIRGPGSALYGANAFAGVINIITKSGGVPNRVSLAGGSNNTYMPTLELSHKGENGLRSYLYADYYSTDGPEEVVESDARSAIFGPQSVDPAGGETKYISKYYNIHTKINFKDFYFHGLFHKTLAKQKPFGELLIMVDGNDTSTNHNAFGEVGYETKVMDNVELSAKAYYDFFRWSERYELLPPELTAFFSDVYSFAEPYPAGDTMVGGPMNKNSTKGGEVTVRYNHQEQFDFTFGALYEYQEQWDPRLHLTNGNYQVFPVVIDGTTYLPMQYFGKWVDFTPDYCWSIAADRTIKAIYGQAMLDLKKLFSLESFFNLGIVTGIRFDDYDDVGSSTNPRVGLIVAPTEKLYFKVLFSSAFRAPNFWEMYTKNNPDVLGNVNVKPETLETLDLLVGYNFTKKMRASLTYFRTNIKDVIQGVYIQEEDEEFGLRRYHNFGTLTSSGIEAEVKAILRSNVYGYANLTYQDLKDTTNNTITSTVSGQSHTQPDLFPGNISNILGNIGINYGVTQNIKADLQLHYVGERARSEAMVFDTTDTLVRADKREDLDAFTLVNLTVSFHDVMTKEFDIQLSSFNMLDADHRDPEPSGLLQKDLPRGGRSFLARASYSF